MAVFIEAFNPVMAVVDPQVERLGWRNSSTTIAWSVVGYAAARNRVRSRVINPGSVKVQGSAGCETFNRQVSFKDVRNALIDPSRPPNDASLAVAES
ncbi:MAG: hypothetical protein GWN04_05780, partial [Gammaproteobacteria bacterium]|nr:hypothetical protein [Gammaproteobacteria bacterium]